MRSTMRSRTTLLGVLVVLGLPGCTAVFGLDALPGPVDDAATDGSIDDSSTADVDDVGSPDSGLPDEGSADAEDTLADDAGASDSGDLGSDDTGVDAGDDGSLSDTGSADTGMPDTTVFDTGTPVLDTGTPDTAPPDTAPPDTGAADTGPVDTGFDAPAECATGRQLRNAVSIDVGATSTFWVTTGDVDNDSKLDLIVEDDAKGGVILLLGNGNGTFGAPSALSTGGSCAPSLGDVDKDGLLDIVVGCPTGTTAPIGVLRNLGSGKFGSVTTIPTDVPSGTLGLAVGDVDNDGKVDAVTGSGAWGGTNNGEILFGLSTSGTSASHKIYSLGYSKIWGGLVADLDHAGGRDAVFDLFYGTGAVTVVLSNASGVSTTAANYGVSGYPIAVRAGDVNFDGWNDLVTGDWATGQVSVLTNQKNGTFAAAVSTNLSFSGCNGSSGCLWDVGAADLNGDGRADIFVPGINDNRLSVLLASSSGTFASVTETYTVAGARGVTSADVNRDGKLDVFVTSTSGPVQLFLHCP